MGQSCGRFAELFTLDGAEDKMLPLAVRRSVLSFLFYRFRWELLALEETLQGANEFSARSVTGAR
jgi:hypothetical protein